ncbi:hypothetical protein [Acidianus brierleyi]|uniref:hypothetical protein n=1 Tax=Acidianus brierleyi TaxID=41673 RepID=UPI0013A5638E|nr:hypothetical protein [Acidianus brierleyi]
MIEQKLTETTAEFSFYSLQVFILKHSMIFYSSDRILSLPNLISSFLLKMLK